ncbi:TNT domain-containing protein [Streptosporangium roseum]|uniref:TNT domain-containing protein n=1 Tax=Streptosporangium roseum TaxID=2001 RepID=UPI00332557A5
MRHFRRRAPLAAAIGLVTAAFTGGAAQAATGTHPTSGPPGTYCPSPSAAGVPVAAGLPCVDTITRPRPAPATDTAPSVNTAPASNVASPTDTVPSVNAGPAVQPVASGRTAPTGDGKPSKQVCGPPYLDDDPILGPKYLPEDGPLGKILRDYKPLNGVSPQEFIDRYWDESTNWWRYPQDYGFAHSGGYANGKLLVRTVTLPVGTDLDRFGGEQGSFVSPLGASYVGRALPPNNLNTFQAAPKYICNYHTYKVIKEFKVDGGPAAAAFQQEGAGRQYHLVSKHIPEAPKTSPEVSVAWLLANGYLKASN